MAIVITAMAVNPDPKPGRWILPLVILGMIAFTYFFVRELPEASTETTLIAGGDSASTTTTLPGDTTPTTSGTSNLDPATQAYVDEVDSIDADLQLQRTAIVTTNTAFDADPREVEFADAVARFQDVVNATDALNDRLNALTAPAGLETNHTSLQTLMTLALNAATEALAGLQSTDEGGLRRSAVETYDTAAADFNTEVTNAHNAAGG